MKLTTKPNPSSKIAVYVRQLFYASLLLMFISVMLYILINSPA